MATIGAMCRWLSVVVGLALFVGEAAGQGEGDFYVKRDKNGRVVEIVVRGAPEWLAKQEDPKSHFHTLPDLRELILVGHDISEEEMKYVASLSKVTHVGVGSVLWGLGEDEVRISGKSLAHVGTMTWLEELEVTAGDLKDADWSFLPGCKSLKTLRTGPDVVLTDRFFDYVSQIKTLESLEFRCHRNSCSDKALKCISELPKVKLLHFSSPNLTDRGMKSLARLTELESLRIYGDFTAQSIEHLRSHRRLKELSLGIRCVPKSAMEIIAQFKDLEELNLSLADVGDEEVAALRGHPTLRELYLDRARVTDRSLKVLESLDQLKFVALRGNDESRRVEKAVNERIRRKKSVNGED